MPTDRPISETEPHPPVQDDSTLFSLRDIRQAMAVTLAEADTVEDWTGQRPPYTRIADRVVDKLRKLHAARQPGPGEDSDYK